MSMEGVVCGSQGAKTRSKGCPPAQSTSRASETYIGSAGRSSPMRREETG